MRLCCTRAITPLGSNGTLNISSLRQAYRCLPDTVLKKLPSQRGLGQNSVNFAMWKKRSELVRCMAARKSVRNESTVELLLLKVDS